MARHRPHMPVSVQRDACLILLGFEPGHVEWDHDLALGLRIYNEATGDYEPPANDPRYIRPRTPADHRAKTTGRRGESELSLTGTGDVSQIWKTRRLEADAIEARRLMLAKAPGVPRQKKHSILSRPFERRPPQQTASRPICRRRP